MEIVELGHLSLTDLLRVNLSFLFWNQKWFAKACPFGIMANSTYCRLKVQGILLMEELPNPAPEMYKTREK